MVLHREPNIRKERCQRIMCGVGSVGVHGMFLHNSCYFYLKDDIQLIAAINIEVKCLFKCRRVYT